LYSYSRSISTIPAPAAESIEASRVASLKRDIGRGVPFTRLDESKQTAKRTIFALDLGQFKTVACGCDGVSGDTRFQTALRNRAERRNRSPFLCRPAFAQKMHGHLFPPVSAFRSPENVSLGKIG
jgi:hypothetical protein